MKKTLRITTALSLIALCPLALACEYPSRVDIPDGATASKDDMLASQQAVKDYMSAMEEYLACIEQEEKDTVATMPDITEEELNKRGAALTKKHNAAVEEMELVAARFNEAVRAYKAQGE
jgi:hypothetical protein